MHMPFKTLVVLCLMFHLQSCAYTLHRWSELPPEREQLSQEERQAAYEHFKIDEIAYGFGENKARLNDSYYDFEAMSSIILARAPDTKALFAELDQNTGFAIGLLFAEIALVMTAYIAKSVFLEEDIMATRQNYINIDIFGLIGISLMTLGDALLMYRNWEIKNRIKDRFNQALKQYYLPEGIDSQLPTPRLELIESSPPVP